MDPSLAHFAHVAVPTAFRRDYVDRSRSPLCDELLRIMPPLVPATESRARLRDAGVLRAPNAKDRFGIAAARRAMSADIPDLTTFEVVDRRALRRALPDVVVPEPARLVDASPLRESDLLSWGSELLSAVLVADVEQFRSGRPVLFDHYGSIDHLTPVDWRVMPEDADFGAAGVFHRLQDGGALVPVADERAAERECGKPGGSFDFSRARSTSRGRRRYQRVDHDQLVRMVGDPRRLLGDPDDPRWTHHWGAWSP
ncbi:hypothetical protein AAEP80_01755 [Curtobacterium sp. L3-7]|uniref:hypothetical protein n=1 Tax=Curtobacterium sp. L3-7 TaxID=3138787 RepID=UPI003B526031